MCTLCVEAFNKKIIKLGLEKMHRIEGHILNSGAGRITKTEEHRF
jgi:hypothetical protein